MMSNAKPVALDSSECLSVLIGFVIAMRLGRTLTSFRQTADLVAVLECFDTI